MNEPHLGNSVGNQIAQDVLRRYPAPASVGTGGEGLDLSKCPKCGGPADNGHDRCLPPNPYLCSKCESGEER